MDDKLHDIIFNPISANIEAFESVIRRYPYFALPGVELLKKYGDKLDANKRDNLKFHLAVVTGDREALFEQTEGAEFEDIYPKETPKPPVTTENALDTFFAKYGTASDTENALLEKLIFNPTPEYAEILAASDDVSQTDTPEEGSLEDCIDKFVNSRKAAPTINIKDCRPTENETKPTIQTSPKISQPVNIQQVSNNSTLSESLAKIFIKQGRYERAFEIISNLSLNNPKKSIYFADQLRFLQKLIIIKQAAERNNDIQK